MSRRRLGEFEPYVRTRAGEVVDEVDEGITKHLGDVATELGLSAPAPPPAPPPTPEVRAPPLKSRRLETQLMMILGAGFGFGVALAVTRLFAGLAPGLTIAGLVAGGLVGLLLTVWVVGIRGLLHDRAVLDRWVTDVTATLRSAVEERVATRVLAAETALTSDLAARDEVESATAADRVAEIDAELREHAVATATGGACGTAGCRRCNRRSTRSGRAVRLGSVEPGRSERVVDIADGVCREAIEMPSSANLNRSRNCAN